MSKTAEQFDAEVSAINQKLKNDLKSVFQAFYDSVTDLAKEMISSDAPEHLRAAIARKAVEGVGAAIDAVNQEIGS